MGNKKIVKLFCLTIFTKKKLFNYEKDVATSLIASCVVMEQ